VVEAAQGGIDTVQSWSSSHVLAENVENLQLMGNWGQSGTGNALANRITSGAGGDTLTGGKGDDLLTGGAGADKFKLAKGDGSDTIADFQASADTVTLDGYALRDFAAVKAAMTQAGADVRLALGGGETLTFKGHAIADFTARDFSILNPTQEVVPPPPPPVTQPEPEPEPDTPDLPVGGAPTTWRNGTSRADNLTGTSGNDYFDGRTGVDTMRGLTGDDTYVVDSNRGENIVELAGQGVDTAIFWGSSWTLTANVENLELRGNYRHTVQGNTLDNRIQASDSNDVINAGAGNDMIIAGTGPARLTGGAGSDMFVFPKEAARNNSITDFQAGADSIELALMMKAIGYAGADPFADGILALKASSAGAVLSIDADGAGAGAGHTIVTVQGRPRLIITRDIAWTSCRGAAGGAPRRWRRRGLPRRRPCRY
jgi:Ca2+-binding RTX toxin-like protein